MSIRPTFPKFLAAVVTILRTSAPVVVIGLAASDTTGKETFGPGRQRYLLYEPGKAHYRIVLPEKPEPEEREAAKLFTDTLKAMGRPAAVSDKTIRVHVGRTPLAVKGNFLPKELDADGFVIRAVGPTDLVLLGGRSVSTFYSVTEFLESYAGVLWLWPGEHEPVNPNQIGM